MYQYMFTAFQKNESYRNPLEVELNAQELNFELIQNQVFPIYVDCRVPFCEIELLVWLTLLVNNCLFLWDDIQDYSCKLISRLKYSLYWKPFLKNHCIVLSKVRYQLFLNSSTLQDKSQIFANCTKLSSSFT